MSGFISLHRKMTEWEWYKNSNTKSLFLHCLLKANWKDKKWQGQVIKRGSFITSTEHLSIETGLSVRQVRTALDKLIMTNELTKTTTNKNTTISITNYNMYQQSDEQDDKQMTNKRQTNDKQMTTTNKDNNINKDNKDIDSAFSLWNEKAPSLGLPLVQKITASRRSKMKARLKDCGGIDGWLAALEKVSSSCFLLGNNERGWKADIDFLLQESSFVKLMEGKYDKQEKKETITKTRYEKKLMDFNSTEEYLQYIKEQEVARLMRW